MSLKLRDGKKTASGFVHLPGLYVCLCVKLPLRNALGNLTPFASQQCLPAI